MQQVLVLVVFFYYVFLKEVNSITPNITIREACAWCRRGYYPTHALLQFPTFSDDDDGLDLGSDFMYDSNKSIQKT